MIEFCLVGGGFIGSELAASLTGIGAKVTMMASELLQSGISRIGEILDEMKRWMEEHEYESFGQMHGSMNFLHCPNPAGLERANYMHMLRSWETSAKTG